MSENIETNQPFDLQGFLVEKNKLRTEINENLVTLKGKAKFDRKDTIGIITKVSTLLNHLDSLNDVVIRDLMIVDQRFQTLEQQIFALVNKQAVVKTLLVDKNVFTDEEMEATWREKVKPEVEKKISEAKAEMEKPQNTGSNLVDPSGAPL